MAKLIQAVRSATLQVRISAPSFVVVALGLTSRTMRNRLTFLVPTLTSLMNVTSIIWDLMLLSALLVRRLLVFLLRLLVVKLFQIMLAVE